MPKTKNKKFIKSFKSSRRSQLLLVGFFLVAGFVVWRLFAAGTTYYVDCSAGADTNSGTSQTAAWRSLSKVSSASLTAGDSVLLKRGCTWTEALNANWSGSSFSPITVSAYGEGELPIITSNVHGREIVTVRGDYINLENLFVRATAPSTDPSCQNNPKGYIVGFSFVSGASFNTVRNSKATGGYAGVFIKSGATNNKVLNNQIYDNIMMNPLDTTANNDAGAFGVLLHGDDNEVAGNEINGHIACSYDYLGGDGAAVELYGGQRNHIHHNKADRNETFTELGNSRSADNIFAYNQVTASIATAKFLVTRGANDGFGPVARTKAYNNTVYLTGASSEGVVCFSGCSSSILTLKNNILWAQKKSIYADAAFDEGYNVYWRTGGSPVVQATISSTSKKADPLFVNTAGLNLRLNSNSPAVNSATSLDYTTDLDGYQVPAGGTPDIGGYEYGSSPASDTPTTSITSPANGATVSNTITISANASDNSGVTRVDFFINGTLKGSDSSSPYSYAWDTTSTANGSYSLTTKAYDAAGNVGTSAAVTVNVANGGSSDTTDPTVTITFPLDNAVVAVRSNVTISATANDNVAVTKVEFYVNGSLICTDTSASYTCNWKVPGKKNASYTITAKSYDAANNPASHSITVRSK